MPIRPTAAKGFSIVFVLVIILLVGVLGLGGWAIWKAAHKNDDMKTVQPSSVRSEELTESVAEPEITVPTDFITYDNEEFGFSFSYPERVGALTADAVRSSHIQLYLKSTDQRGTVTNHTSGFLNIMVRAEQDFVAGAQKYGPQLKYQDGKWIVTAKQNGDINNGGYTIGSTYDVKTVRIIGGVPVYDFSSGDEGCYHASWIFKRDASWVTIVFPSVCADSIDIVPQERMDAYKKVIAEILKTLQLSKETGRQ